MDQETLQIDQTVLQDLEIQETAKSRSEIIAYQLNQEFQMMQFKDDLQGIKDALQNLKSSDLKSLKLKIDQIEIELNNTINGKHVVSVTQKIIHSQQFQQTLEVLLRDKAITACDSRIKQFAALFSQKLTFITNDINNLAVSNRNLEQQFVIVQDKVGIVDNLMGFIERHKQETDLQLKKDFSHLQEQVMNNLNTFAESLSHVQMGVISLQDLQLDLKLNEQQHQIEQLSKELQISSGEQSVRLISLGEQLKKDFESQILEISKKHVFMPQRLMSPQQRLSSAQRVSKVSEGPHLKSEVRNNNKNLEMEDSRLNFLVNIVQVERFLVDEQKQFVQKEFEIEKAYLYEDLFSQMIDKVDQLKSLFERCQKDMQCQIQDQIPPVTCYLRPKTPDSSVSYRQLGVMNQSLQLARRGKLNRSVGKYKINRPLSQATSRALFENIEIPQVFTLKRSLF